MVDADDADVIVTFTGAEVVASPSLSVAIADSWYVPAVDIVTLTLYGDVTSDFSNCPPW